jgi:O-acetyl-ADP-ribose deacetylase (regulator of RNase III)
MQSIEILLGDITQTSSDAVVNSANRNLLAGGGVCGAIHRAAGGELELACRTFGHCETGQAIITPSFALKRSTGAEHVIHAVGPRYIDGKRGEAELLKSTYRAILEAAASLSVSTISIPSISTGIYRFPLEEASAIAVQTLRAHAPNDLICKIVCFDEETNQAYHRALG